MAPGMEGMEGMEGMMGEGMEGQYGTQGNIQPVESGMIRGSQEKRQGGITLGMCIIIIGVVLVVGTVAIVGIYFGVQGGGGESTTAGMPAGGGQSTTGSMQPIIPSEVTEPQQS